MSYMHTLREFDIELHEAICCSLVPRLLSVSVCNIEKLREAWVRGYINFVVLTIISTK